MSDAENENPNPQDAELKEPVEPPSDSALEILQRQRDDFESRLLRVTADYQNYVRRAGQHSMAAAEQKLIDVARALVTVLDHFDHALEVDPEKTSPQAMVDGMRIVHNELMQTLERFGIKRFDAAVGEEFNPNQHEALMRQSVEGIAPDHVTAQFQPGYAISSASGDRTLRPAKVAVAQ
jgi:molecular chaperone GrpE